MRPYLPHAWRMVQQTPWERVRPPGAAMKVLVPLVIYGFPGWPSRSWRLFGIDATFDRDTTR